MDNMYVAQNQDVAYRVIEDEAVVLTPDNGMLHNLSLVGTRIFELANGKRKIKDIVNVISDEFEVDQKVAQRDTINFIEDLVHKKMLILSEKPLQHSR